MCLFYSPATSTTSFSSSLDVINWQQLPSPMAAAASFSKPLQFALLSLLPICLFPSALALTSCNGPCSDPSDCEGQLICTGGRCSDDPDVGTRICTGAGSLSTEEDCSPTGTMECYGRNYETYTCSPPVFSSTDAILTLNNFSQGGDGGGPSKCDQSYHDDWEPVVALSTGWYAGGTWCGRMIRITTSDGTSTTAKVVDECDSMNGCDEEHAFQGPCRNNIVDGSLAVWKDLRLDPYLNDPPVTWSEA